MRKELLFVYGRVVDFDVNLLFNLAILAHVRDERVLLRDINAHAWRTVGSQR